MSFRRDAVVAAAVLVSALPSAVHAQQRAHPMSVRLLAPLAIDRPLRFVLNQPGYIAAFVVTPGQGVRMIYPLTNKEQLQWAGFHDESLIGLHFDDEAYDVVLGRAYWLTQGFGAGAFDGPSYLYVIASRWPLDVTRFVHRPSALQRTVGYENARSLDSEDAFTALLNSVVSLGADDSWDSDVYMLWAPAWIDHAPHSFQEAIRYNMPTRVLGCRDGRSIVVPLNYSFNGCPGEARIVPVRQARPPIQRLASQLPAPTILPTIRGVRTVRAANSTPVPVANGFLTSAAGGVTSTALAPENGDEGGRARPGVAVLDEVPVYVGRSSRERFLRGWDGGDRDRPGRERGWDHQERAEHGSPVAAPRPIGVPAPGMAPAPAAAPAASTRAHGEEKAH